MYSIQGGVRRGGLMPAAAPRMPASVIDVGTVECAEAAKATVSPRGLRHCVEVGDISSK